VVISAGREFGSPRPRSTALGTSPVVARLVDSRGLTVPAAVLLAVVLSVSGGTIDAATGSGLRTLFAICFCAGCLAAALLVRIDGLRATVVMPPLVYVLVALIAGTIEVTGVTGSFLTQELLELATELITGAPVLVVGTLIAAGTAGLRHTAHRQRVLALQQHPVAHRPPDPRPASWH